MEVWTLDEKRIGGCSLKFSKNRPSIWTQNDTRDVIINWKNFQMLSNWNWRYSEFLISPTPFGFWQLLSLHINSFSILLSFEFAIHTQCVIHTKTQCVIHTKTSLNSIFTYFKTSASQSSPCWLIVCSNIGTTWRTPHLDDSNHCIRAALVWSNRPQGYRALKLKA